MEFPDSRVQNIVNNLRTEQHSDQSSDLAKEIESLSPLQRFQIFCLVKDTEFFDSDQFFFEIKLWNRFLELFRSDYAETSFLIQNLDSALGLAETALLAGLLDLEDYRSIIRYLYTNTEDYDTAVLKINTSLLLFLHIKNAGSRIPNILSLFLRFLGVPLANIEELKADLQGLFPEAKSKINSFFELPINTIQKYPQYLDELTEQLNYDRDIPTLKNWLDHETLFKLEKEKIARFTKSWKPESINSVDELVTALEIALPENNLSMIPLVFDSFIKAYSASLKPQNISSKDLNANIPQRMLNTYVEKLAYPISSHKDVKIRITFLGGCQIGSMGILISTPQSNILIDYGMSVANYQIPYWNEALNHLDAILLTHAHLDHSGAIPYLFSQNFKGYVFGSGMTKNLANMLLTDSLNLMNKNISETIRKTDHRFKYLSKPAHLYQMFENYINIKSGKEYHLTPDIVIKPFSANHIQGSLAYLVECAGNKRIFFSGDFNLDSTALFKNKSPNLPQDANLSIIDSTYFGQLNFDHKKRDDLLFQTVKEDNRVIIPAFSVGRAQEIMIKLEKAGLTKERKVSMLGMATKVARISGLKTKGHLSDHLAQQFEDEVVISGGGMLSGGYAREFVEQTKEDHNTSIVLCGFLAKSTLGYRLLHKLEPQYKQKVVFTRFSGHSSNDSLRSFLDSLKGQKALVHLGNLTKDPLTSEKIRNSKDFSHSDYYIPSLGSSLEI